MKKFMLLVTCALASSVSYAEIIGSGIDLQSGQHCQWIKSESDGSGSKTGEDGSGTKVGQDGTGNKSNSDGTGNKTANDGSDKDYHVRLVCK